MSLRIVIGQNGSRQDSDAEVVYLGNDADAAKKAIEGNTSSRFFYIIQNPQYVGLRKVNTNYREPSPPAVEPVEPVEPDLSGMSKGDLVKLAKERGIAVPAKTSKGDLVEILSASPVDPVEPDLSEMSKGDLVKLAEERGIAVPASADKGDLVEILSAPAPAGDESDNDQNDS